MGIDFTIIEGKGPKILSPIKDKADVDKVRVLENVADEVPFLGPILQVRTMYFTSLLMMLRTLLISLLKYWY